MTPVKVAMVVPELALSADLRFVGGSAVSMTRLANWLSLRGHQVTVFCGTTLEGAARLRAAALPWDSVVPIVMRAEAPSKNIYGAEFSIRVFVRLLRALAFQPYDLVHGHSGFGQVAAAPLLAAAVARVPYLHSLYCPVPKRGDPNRPGGSWLLGFLRRASAVMAISERTAVSLGTIGIDARRIHVVPPVIPQEEPTPDGETWVRDLLGQGPDHPVLLYVGNLHPSKGLDSLVEALPAVLSAYPTARLIVTLALERSGYSATRNRIKRRLKELGIGERVLWVGITPYLPSLIASSDVVVVPFRHTFGPSDYPLVILEAMSLGTPTIATSVGGVPEIIRHEETGILVPPDDPAGLASAVIRVLGDGTLRQRLVAGGQTVVAGFRPDVIGERVCRIYQEVLANR